MADWLQNVGGITVDRVPVTYGANRPVIAGPAQGVLHTTEGSFESAYSEFQTHFAPTFLIGKDASGRVRIVQFVPIGVTANALEHHAVETNARAAVQIEIVAKSQKTPWLPDTETTAALASLMNQLQQDAGIPLVHAGGAATRGQDWNKKAGWYGHIDVPGNTHWDPGNLKWGDLLKMAGGAAPAQVAMPASPVWETPKPTDATAPAPAAGVPPTDTPASVGQPTALGGVGAPLATTPGLPDVQAPLPNQPPSAGPAGVGLPGSVDLASPPHQQVAESWQLVARAFNDPEAQRWAQNSLLGVGG